MGTLSNTGNTSLTGRDRALYFTIMNGITKYLEEQLNIESLTILCDDKEEKLTIEVKKKVQDSYPPKIKYEISYDDLFIANNDGNNAVYEVVKDLSERLIKTKNMRFLN